jgi:hypothetical protein
MKNGKLPSGKRTKHLDIQYFYVKDLIDRGVLSVGHCISDNMIAEFFTKPLQGSCFKQLRDVILNLNHQEFAMEHRSMLENSDLSICSNAEIPRKSEPVAGPSELCVRE